MEDYVVMTRVTPVRAGGRIIVHTYGPYTKSKAQSVKAEFLRAARELKYADRLEVNACKVLEDR
jgi:hypothetical protein